MVWSARDAKPIRKSFATIREARAWRQEAQVEVRHERLRAPCDVLLKDAAEQWLADAERGIVRTRSARPYKPAAIRSYDAALRRFVLPRLGELRLSALTRVRVQDLVDELVAAGYAPSTVANAVLPLRAIFRRAIDRDEVVVNPTERLRLPRDRPQRDRVIEPREIAALLAALPDHHRGLWATAAYTGLRRGELQALRWQQVDFNKGVIEVTHSWDRVAGLVAPKSLAAERLVPVPARLRGELIAHRLRQGAGDQGFVFAFSAEKPFDPPNVLRVAHRAWKRAGIAAVSFHQCRHVYASHMIAAGVNAKALSSFMGHSSITVTLDRYGQTTLAVAMRDHRQRTRVSPVL